MRRGALVLLLALLVGMVIAPIHPVSATKGNPDHITFVKLSDIEFRDESGQGITMTKGWLKNLLKVEWGYGSYTNATLVWDGKRLTVYLQDDTKHDGRWFALNEQILKKVGIDPDSVSVSLDTQAPAEVVKRLKADGKWFYFYIDHFTVRYVTFEASEGYVELSDFGWQNYTKLIEPDPYCEDCAIFAPLDDLVDNGDGTGDTTIYVNGQASTATVYFNSTTGYPKLTSGKIGNALEFDGQNSETVAISSLNENVSATRKMSIVLSLKLNSIKPSTVIYLKAEGVGGPTLAGITINSLGQVYAYVVTQEPAQVATNGIQLQTGIDYMIRMNLDNNVLSLTVVDENGNMQTVSTTVDFSTLRFTIYTLNAVGIGDDYYSSSATTPNGVIDEVRVYVGKVVSDDEISLIYHLGRYRYALYRGDEASLPSWLNATLFCPLDSINPDNTTTCYLNGAEQSAAVTFVSGYPHMVSGVIGNALEFLNQSTDYVSMPAFTATNEIDLFFAFKPLSTTSGDVFYDFSWATHKGFGLMWLGDRMNLGYGNGSTQTPITIIPPGVISIGSLYYIRLHLNATSAHVEVYDENKQKIYENDYTLSLSLAFQNGGIVVGKFWNLQTAHFALDEFRARADSKFTDSEIQMLLHLNRHKFATLSAPSASYNGTHFLVNVTAQLPGDGGSYLLPAPLNAVSSYSSAGSIGNFTFLQVGTASTASFQVPVPKDLSAPAGINLLAWMYNDEIYITGRSDQFPLIATVMNLPKGVWGLENGRVVKNVVYKDYTKLIIANVTGPSYVSRLPNLFVEPQGVDYVNVSVLRHSPEGVEINASAPGEGDVVFTVGGLWKDHRYNLYVDGDKIETLKTSDTGWLTFTWSDWSDHIIYIQPYSAGEEFLYDMGDIAVAMIMGAIIAPLASLIYVVGLYLQQASGRNVDWSKTLDFLIEEFMKFLVIAWIAIAGLTALVMVALSI